MHGAGFSIAQFLPNRHGSGFITVTRNKNLYFAAAGAHPGAGMPGVLCSAKVVETLVAEDDPKAARGR